ncbi:MAG: hypothetical protein IJW69_01685, partial [Clostridia bacterium]|nr:hypothetical protein [Clostridia bacterium]
LALFSARVLYAAQNDVKFQQTPCGKSFGQAFSKACGAWGRAPHKLPDKSKFEVLLTNDVECDIID